MLNREQTSKFIKFKDGFGILHLVNIDQITSISLQMLDGKKRVAIYMGNDSCDVSYKQVEDFCRFFDISEEDFEDA